MINLMYAGGAKLFEGLTMSLLSITKHCKQPLSVYIITGDFSENGYNEKQIQFLDNIVKRTNNQSKVIKLDVTKYKDELNKSVNAKTKYTVYSFLRLLADRLDLPSKILYLDVDVMAYNDISPLYETDITNYEIAVVRDYFGKLFLGPRYFNSGVMLINMDKVKETGLFKRALEICMTQKMLFPDQTALNKCAKYKKYLPTRYNSQKKLYKDTVIRHFCKTIKFLPYFHTLNIKPWHTELLHQKYKCYEFDDIIEEGRKAVKEFEGINKMNKIIPVFFTTDKGYMPLLSVAMGSLIKNINTSDYYKIYVLSSSLTKEERITQQDLDAEFNELPSNVSIEAVDISSSVKDLQDAVLGHYSIAMFYRLFIPRLFPQYNKVVYLDCDVVINDDIAKMYNTDIKDNYAGVVLDQIVINNPEFMEYVLKFVGMDNKKQYFNTGVLLINSERWRAEDLDNKLIQFIKSNKSPIAPDQDFLNSYCKGQVTYLEDGWDEMPLGKKLEDKDIHILHYNLFLKPWKYKNLMYEDYFWKYAKNSKYYNYFLDTLASYTDKQREEDQQKMRALLNVALQFANKSKKE